MYIYIYVHNTYVYVQVHVYTLVHTHSICTAEGLDHKVIEFGMNTKFEL